MTTPNNPAEPMTPDDFKGHRDTLGYSQEKMADALGISQPAVSMMESGDRPITTRTARQVQQLLILNPLRSITP